MTTTETTADIAMTVSQQDAATTTLAVTVPAERVRAAEEAAVRWYGSRARIAGFRKGHIPAPVVRRRFGDAIRQTVLQDLVRETWEKARSEHSLRPIGDPRIRVLKFEDGSPLSFELTVDVKPEIALERLGGFRLTRRIAPVADEAVEAQLLALREQRAPWVPAEGRAKAGDLVAAIITNLEEPETASGEPVRFVLGQGRALPELEAQLMRLNCGETWEGTVRFPDDHPDEAKRGKSRPVRVTLQEMKRQQLPDLDDSFAGEVGRFASVAELRAAVRADLETDARREGDARLRTELLDQIAAANNVAVPPSLLERALFAYAQAYGVPEDQRPRFTAEMRPVAEAQVRRDLIIEAVADRAGLHATAGDVEARLAEIAHRRGEELEQVRASLDKAGRLREIERGLTEEKVFAHLLGQSAVDEAPAVR